VTRNSRANQVQDMTESADNAAGGGLSESIRESVSAYYTGKIKKHGPTPLGVDWNSLESQELRFSQLTKVIAEDSDFSINDYGCGYGALADYLDTKGFDSPDFQQVSRRGAIIGSVNMVPILLILVMMVFKPTL